MYGKDSKRMLPKIKRNSKPVLFDHKIKVGRYPKILVALQAFFIFAWLSILTDTDSFYGVYVLCAILGIMSIWDLHVRVRVGGTYKDHLSGNCVLGVILLAAVFSVAVILANYPLVHLFSEYEDIFAGFRIFCMFFGGWSIAANILLSLLIHIPLPLEAQLVPTRPVAFFCTCFFLIAAVDLTFLWGMEYPGILTRDSISTIRQIITGEYNNTMPFWHTKTVEVFYRIGYALYGEINAAIAFYMSVQVLFLAACLAYALVTMYQSKVPRWYLFCAAGIYLLLPYQIYYSVTLWKDVLFGAAACLMGTSLYRIIRKIGKSSALNGLLFTIGSIGFCLWRTNGWYAFLVAALVMVFAMRGRFYKVRRIMAAIAVICWILLNPLLSMWSIPETDMVEAFSIPLQQIARVIADECWIEEEDEQLLSQAFDLEVMHDEYVPYLADPIKFHALRRENIIYVQEHLIDYAKLYLRLGHQYPGEYWKAWIEQTKGYWNGGYNGGFQYYMYAEGVCENDFGIQNTVRSDTVINFFDTYFMYVEWNGLSPVLYGIGLQVWILVACFFVNICKKRDEFLLEIPLLILMAGLWLGTPVYAEFRYAYPLVLSIPVVLAASLFHAETGAESYAEKKRA